MPLPSPEPGLVLSYAYLWRHEHDRGQEDGLKDRPCAVTVVVEKSATDIEVWVVPITHRPPADPETAIEIPPLVKTHLGLDHERSWIVADEVNQFIWPGPDLRPLPKNPARFAYGFLPPKLFERIKARMLKLHQQKKLRATPRTP